MLVLMLMLMLWKVFETEKEGELVVVIGKSFGGKEWKKGVDMREGVGNAEVETDV